MNSKFAIAAAAFSLALPVFAQAPDPARGPAPAADPAKTAAVRQLLSVTSASKLGDNAVSGITAQVKQVVGTQITDQTKLNTFMDAFGKNLATRVSADQINDAEVAIYAKHLSLADIQALIAFYQSDAGKDVMKALPLIDQEAVSAANAMTRPAALDTLRQMAPDYPELARILPPANTSVPSSGVEPGTSPAPAGSAPTLRQIPSPSDTPAPAQSH